MKAVSFSNFGGPEVLEIVELSDPHPGPGRHGVRFSSGDAGRAVHALAKIGELVEA
jgi:hypothetical protein